MGKFEGLCLNQTLDFNWYLPKDDLKLLLYYKCESAANTAGVHIVKFLYFLNQRKYDMVLSKQSWDKKLGIHGKHGNGTSVVRLTLMVLAINFLVLPKANFSINGNCAMHMDRWWPSVLLGGGGWVDGCHWAVLFWRSPLDILKTIYAADVWQTCSGFQFASLLLLLDIMSSSFASSPLLLTVSVLGKVF